MGGQKYLGHPGIGNNYYNINRRSALSQQSSAASSGNDTNRSNRISNIFDHESSLFISPALSALSSSDSRPPSVLFLDLDDPTSPDTQVTEFSPTQLNYPDPPHPPLGCIQPPSSNRRASQNAPKFHSQRESYYHRRSLSEIQRNRLSGYSANRDSCISIINDPFFQSLQFGSVPVHHHQPPSPTTAPLSPIEVREQKLDEAYKTSFIDTDPDPEEEEEEEEEEYQQEGRDVSEGEGHDEERDVVEGFDRYFDDLLLQPAVQPTLCQADLYEELYLEEESALALGDLGAKAHRAQERFGRRESLVIGKVRSGVNLYIGARIERRLNTTMESLNIAVIGAVGSGKSTFIQRVLGLSRPPLSEATSLSFPVDGAMYSVTLVELDLEYFDFGVGQMIQWPKQINGHITPQVDGALMLYDVTNRETVKDLHKTLDALTNSGLPAVLVACKCDRPQMAREVNAEGMAKHEHFKACVDNFTLSSTKPEHSRICLTTILRSAIKIRREAHEPSSRRRAASTTANLDAPFDSNHSARPLSQHSKHSRASSDMSAIRGFVSNPLNPDQYSHTRARSPRSVFASEIFGAADNIQEEPADHLLNHNLYHHVPASTATISTQTTHPISLEIAPWLLYTPTSSATTPTTISTTFSNNFSSFLGNSKRAPNIRLNSVTSSDSFLDMDESDGEGNHHARHSSLAAGLGLNLSPSAVNLHDSASASASSRRPSDDVPILQQDGDAIYDKDFDKSSRRSGSSGSRMMANGVTFDGLVDRLLALRMTKAEHNFAEVFLCLYRKFAAPGQLFQAILVRLDRVRDDKSQHYLTKTATQLRYIDVVVRWVSLYPGDFARPSTWKQLREFVRHLSTEPIFAVAAQQIQTCLASNVVDDDDTGWEKSDDATETEEDRLVNTSAQSHGSDMFSGISTLRLEDDDHIPSHGLDLEIHDPSSLSAGSGIQCHYNSFEEYERTAAKLIPSATLPMNKSRYHQFMDIPNEDIVDELTRMDWVMFCSIRIRDFVRHVSLSKEAKAKAKSLKNVQHMISHFNHVAIWVSNMILLRDKPKHRAQIFDKFIDIAHKLRAKNNYNGLAAVLAGLNSTSIHRLAQTKTLLTQEALKQLAMLTLLMATQKSHFAYRLAWENSSIPRIPFIPLHLRDLVSAEEGNPTIVPGPNSEMGEPEYINWGKFEILGEVLLPIMRSQGSEYRDLHVNTAARELILECNMPTDEDEIYARSTSVESTASINQVASGDGKKKFPWFVK